MEVKGVWASQPEEAEAWVSQLEEAVVSRPQEVAVVEVVEVEVVAAEV